MDVHLRQLSVRCDRMAEEAFDVGLRQPLQDKDTAAREQSVVDLKGGIFRRRSDEDNASLLHKRQKRILLRLVKAMNLIDKDDDALSVHTTAIRFLHHRTDLLDPARHSRERDELRLRTRGDDLRQSRLADAGRSPENHRGDSVTLNEAAQYLPLP